MADDTHEPHTDDAPTDDAPSLRQRLHQATGDREREAKALADRTDDAIDEEDAKLAVHRASGDFEEPAAPDQTARASDAEAAHDERSS
jgi:hypothetical protein